MKRASALVSSAVLLLVVSIARDGAAQLNNAAAVRGQVKDEQGQPLAGVNVELEFKGESRVKIVKKTTTDKKGGYIYSGLLPGAWTFHFTKAGYKQAQLNTNISLGGISDIEAVTLAVSGGDASVAGAIGAAAPIAGPSAGPGVSADKSKELAAKYTAAIAAMKAGSPAEAETLLKELIAVVPGFAPAHQALGSVYAGRGDTAGAEAEYRKLVELDPGTAVSHLVLSNFLTTVGRNEEAFKALQDAAPKFPQDALLQFALGATAFNLGKSDEAQAAFLKAVELDPSSAEPNFYLGSLAVSANDVPKAVAYFEKYVSIASASAANLGAAKALLETLKKKK
jgi:tetratricopeptide (TPR) repeat protein